VTFDTRYPVVTVGDITSETQYGTSAPASTSVGGLPILRMNNITREGRLHLEDMKWIELSPGEMEKYTVRRGDLLFNRTNSPELVGKTAVWDQDGPHAFAGYLIRVRFDPRKAIPEYVSAFLNSPWGKQLLFTRAKPSVNMSNISATDLLRLPLPLPPLEDQRRIAGIFDKANGIRWKRRTLVQLLSRLARALFLDAFGDVVLNERGWRAVAVEDVGQVQLGRQRAPKYQTGQHTRPYLRVANVFEDRIDTGDVLSMDFDAGDFERYRLETGDILLNEGQSTELVGRPAIWQDEIENCCFQNTLVRFRADRSKAEPEFALGVFLEYLRGGAFARVSSKTSNVAHLGAARFAAMPFPLPPLDAQRKYSRQRLKLREVERKALARQGEEEELFNSLVERAFRGDL
jgi:type I restriction enzyme S subunit